MENKNKDRGKLSFQSLKDLAAKGAESIDVDSLKDSAQIAGKILGNKAAGLKDSTMAMKEELTDKISNLDNEAAGIRVPVAFTKKD